MISSRSKILPAPKFDRFLGLGDNEADDRVSRTCFSYVGYDNEHEQNEDV